ncbi:MAG: hypothetical protein U1C97_01715 [Candidatus Gracilibacteria bacterium]|nr:hypothetical protein [bacterium]MDZ4217017.1 hypothetical protein [Candidatus Gracilibacteria bacterium]
MFENLNDMLGGVAPALLSVTFGFVAPFFFAFFIEIIVFRWQFQLKWLQSAWLSFKLFLGTFVLGILLAAVARYGVSFLADSVFLPGGETATEYYWVYRNIIVIFVVVPLYTLLQSLLLIIATRYPVKNIMLGTLIGVIGSLSLFYILFIVFSTFLADSTDLLKVPFFLFL